MRYLLYWSKHLQTNCHSCTKSGPGHTNQHWRHHAPIHHKIELISGRTTISTWRIWGKLNNSAAAPFANQHLMKWARALGAAVLQKYRRRRRIIHLKRGGAPGADRSGNHQVSFFLAEGILCHRVYQSIASERREIARSQPEGSRQGNVYRVPGDNRSQRAHSNRTNHGSACRAGAASALAGPSSSSIYAHILSPAAASSINAAPTSRETTHATPASGPLSDGRTAGRTQRADGVQQRESGRRQPTARRAAAPPPTPQPPGPPLGRETPAGRSHVLPRPRLQLLAGTCWLLLCISSPHFFLYAYFYAQSSARECRPFYAPTPAPMLGAAPFMKMCGLGPRDFIILRAWFETYIYYRSHARFHTFYDKLGK